MIFYFSGTGNSLYAANRLANVLDDTVMSMTDLLEKGKTVFRFNSNETCGLVFPVYFYGLPTVVKRFISALRFDGSVTPYVYAVITCGSSVAACDRMLRKELDKRRIELNCVFDLKMPDNYVCMYNPASRVRSKKIMLRADALLDKICRMIAGRSRKGYRSIPFAAVQSTLLYSLYGKDGRKTSQFYADYKCIGCGRCVRVCPDKAIEMYKGKPMWVKNKCAHCTACINGCPKSALQYGKSTASRLRYLNDIIKTNTEVDT